MQRWAHRKVVLSIALSILLHVLWLGSGIANRQGEAGIVDRILGKPSYVLTGLLVPEHFMNKGLLVGWLVVVFVSLLFYGAIFWLILVIAQRCIKIGSNEARIVK
jgi:hypothetical protein